MRGQERGRKKRGRAEDYKEGRVTDVLKLHLASFQMKSTKVQTLSAATTACTDDASICCVCSLCISFTQWGLVAQEKHQFSSSYTVVQVWV